MSFSSSKDDEVEKLYKLEEEKINTSNIINDVHLQPNPKESTSRFFLVDSKKEEIKKSKKFLKKYSKVTSQNKVCQVIQSSITLKDAEIKSHVKVVYTHVKLFPSRPIKAIIFVNHGMGSLFEVDFLSANYYAEMGIESIGFDQPSHGRTCPKEDISSTKGSPTLITDYKSLILNSLVFMKTMHDSWKDDKRYKGVKYFIWGDSMGGAISLSMGILFNYSERWKKMDYFLSLIGGIITSCPAIEPVDKPSWKILESCLSFFSSIAPSLPLPGSSFMNTRFKEYHEWYNKHPLTMKGGPKLATARELLRIGEYVETNVEKNLKPLLIFSGDNDKMVKPESIKRFFRKSKSVDKTLIVFKGGGHALTIDYGAKQQAEWTIKWILNRSDWKKMNNDEKKEGEEGEGEGIIEEGS